MTSLADIAGSKVWAMGLARDVVRGIGAEPSDQAAPDLSAALATGGVAAAEAGGAIASHALGIFERAPYSLGASINRPGTALSLGFSRAVWDAMSQGDQAIVSAICSAELHTAIAEEKAHRQMLLAPLQKAKPEKAEPSDLVVAISRVSDGVVAHLASFDPGTQRINASYAAFRRAIGIRPLVLST
jgi:TRAP-type mannitol/chloroaromatic compound transport system substrate-binding protein